MHLGRARGAACEGYAHRTAKLLIAKRWQDARLVPACTACGIYDKRGALSLPSEGTAVNEHPIAAGELAARPDVLIFTPEGQPHTAIEIFDSSAVKDSAAKVYAALGIVCAEVDATSVLEAFESSPPKEIHCRRVLPTPPRCSRCASAKRVEPTKMRWLVPVPLLRREGAPAERVQVKLPPGRLYGSDVSLFAPRKKPDER